MPACPVCDRDVLGDEDAVARHVNAHFEGGGDADVEIVGGNGLSSTTSHAGVPPTTETCFICGADLAGFDGAAANAHVNACLDGGEGGAPMPEITPDDYEDYDDNDYYDSDKENEENAVVSRSGRKVADAQWDGTVFADKSGGGDKVSKGDKWWDPARGSLAAGAVPLNFSPGLIHVLRDMLQRSASSGSTRSAVLARDGVHIKGSFGFDSSWGCGYRNGLMAIATMQASNMYTSVFANRADPGVRTIQHWIEEAWRAGFDVAGRDQLRGKVVGTQRWIGTTDLYAMFSYMGIPSMLYDFNKPADREGDEPTHKILERWVRKYFDEDEVVDMTDDNAFTELMRPKVRIGTKLPFILQHAGHSRTVVGYELAGKDINLLVFDPGKSVPKDVREAGIAAARNARDTSAPSSTDPSDPRPSTVQIREDSAAAAPSSDEEVRSGGWVRKKKSKKGQNGPADPLLSGVSPFRTNLGRWKHNQFQVLVFPGTSLLSPSERDARKVVDSVDVQH